MSLSTEQSPSLVEIREKVVLDSLAALSVLSRRIFKEELKRALLDTNMDYHRESDQEAQLLLASEVHSLNVFIGLIEQVDKELEEG